MRAEGDACVGAVAAEGGVGAPAVSVSGHGAVLHVGGAGAAGAPLSETLTLRWLRACCAVAEGADVPLSHAVPDASSHYPPDMCVAAVLGDALHRVTVLGGREGMPRSLASVYGGSVTRFLVGGVGAFVSRVIETPGVRSVCNGVAVSPDGSTLLVSTTAVVPRPFTCTALWTASGTASLAGRTTGR